MNIYSKVHALAQKITETTKSSKKKSVAHLTLNVFLFQIVRQQTEMTHQQQVSRSVSCIIRAEREHFEHMQ